MPLLVAVRADDDHAHHVAALARPQRLEPLVGHPAPERHRAVGLDAHGVDQHRPGRLGVGHEAVDQPLGDGVGDVVPGPAPGVEAALRGEHDRAPAARVAHQGPPHQQAQGQRPAQPERPHHRRPEVAQHADGPGETPHPDERHVEPVGQLGDGAVATVAGQHHEPAPGRTVGGRELDGAALGATEPARPDQHGHDEPVGVVEHRGEWGPPPARRGPRPIRRSITGHAPGTAAGVAPPRA